MNVKEAEDAEDPPPLAAYGKAVDQDVLSIINQQKELEEERRRTISGFSSSCQQILQIPKTNDFIIAVTILKIREDVSISKLVNADGGYSG